MKRSWLLAGAGIAVLALVGWAIAVRDQPERARPDVLHGAGQQARPADAGPAPSVLVELVLLPDGPVRAIPGSVRIGLGYVSPDDAARAPAALEDGPHAEASSYADLAVPARWAPAPANLLPNGQVKVGPIRLPSADQYTLQARGEDGLRFYMARFTSSAVPAEVSPLVGAGVRPRVASAGTAVLLRRVASSVPPPAWQRLQEWTAPQLLEAFSDEPLPVQDGQVLAPLAPGPIEIVLEVNGVEAERRLVSLPAGRIVDVHFDPTSQAVARAVSMDLELEFVRKGNGKPIEGLRVDWLGGRTQQTQTTDARGRVTFNKADRQQAHQFNLLAIPPKTGLPEWPELRPIQIEPHDLIGTGTPGEVVRRRIELAPLRWLVASLPAEAARISQTKRSPYPIYVLQRQRDGRWQDAAADHFIPTPERLAVSISEPGAYRIAAALSPWRVLESSVAQISDATRQSVDFATVRGTDVTVTLFRDGKALTGVPVHIIGPVGRLPPALLSTDGHGRVVLPAATAPWVRMEIPGSDQIEVRLTGTQALADFGSHRAQ